MPKDRRSFFEKLTGTIAVNKDHEDELENYPTRPVEAEADADWEEVGELSVDVYETPDDVVVKTMIAGVKPEDVTIDISREVVTIKGARESVNEVATDNYHQKELFWGGFARTILLPAEIDTDGAEATEKHGLLTIRMPKIDKDKRQKLKVKSQ